MDSSKEVLTPVRLVGDFSGFMILDEGGINQLSNLLESTNSDGVIILSVVGPRGSGKSFFLNLMLKYLRSGGKGDWWNDLSKKNEPLKGFATRDTKNAADCSGIYFWPEVLTVTACDSTESSEDEVKKYPVILLDSFFEDQRDELRSPAVDMFLCMVSSKVIINSVKRFKPEDLMPLQSVMNSKADQIIHCNQVTILVRDSEASPYGHSRAMSHITDVLKKSSGDVPDFAQMIDEMKLTEACLMKQPYTIPLCDPSGHLNYVDTAFVRSFKTFMNTLLDSGSLIKGARKIPDFKEFIRQNVCCASDLHLRLECKVLEEKGSSNTSGEGHADEVKVTEQILQDNKKGPPSLLETENHSESMAKSPGKTEQEVNSSNLPKFGKMISMKDGKMNENTRSESMEQTKPNWNHTATGITDEEVEVQTIVQEECSHQMQSSQPLERSRVKEPEVYGNHSDTDKSVVRVFSGPSGIQSRSCITRMETKKSVETSAYFPPEQCPSTKEMRNAPTPGSSSGMTIQTSSSDSQSLPSYALSSVDSNIQKSSQMASSVEKQPHKPLSTDTLKLCEAEITKIPEAHGIESDYTIMSQMQMLEFALKNQHESMKKELLKRVDEQSVIVKPAEQTQLESLEVSAFRQRSEPKSKPYQEKISCDKDRRDKQIEELFMSLKRDFDAELKTHPQELQDHLVVKYGENFKHLLAVKFELPTDQVQSTATKLTDWLNVTIKRHNSNRKPQLQETSVKANEDDKIDCSPPSPTSEELESSRNKGSGEEVNEPIETVQPTEVNENAEVVKLLSDYCKELYDFSKTVNIYRQSSYLLVEKKIEELTPLYFQEIEDKILQENHPNSPLLSKMITTIKQINYDLACEFYSAQKDYESCLKSLSWKLEDATGKMAGGLINGDRTPNPASVFYDVFTSHAQTMQQKSKELIQTMLQEDTAEFLSAMTDLEEGLMFYRRQMVKHSEMYYCMSLKAFENFHQEFHTEARAKLKSDSSFMSSQLANGIRRMFELFTKTREGVINMEHEITSHIAQNDPKIKNFYNEMMKELTRGTLWTPSQLQQLHEDVVREVTEAFKSACFLHDSGLDFSIYGKMIKTHVQPLFSSYQEQNKRKGDALIVSVKTAIDNQRRSYNYKMDECLKKAGGVMDLQELKEHHDSFLTDVCNALRFELTKMEGLGDHSSHFESLRNKIESDWSEFEVENMRKFRLKQRELQRNKKAEEAVLKEKALEEERQQRLRMSTTSTDSIFLSSTSLKQPSSQSTTVEVPTKNSQSPLSTCSVQLGSARVLKPLAIEFGLHVIRVGWINPETNKFEILKNELSNTDTPSVIAMTIKDKEILIGEEAIRRRLTDVKWKYSMSKLILENKRPEMKSVLDDKLMRKELLMGLMLSKVKEGVELQLNGIWETVVLTVPLWYTSVLRQATRDAATIAGFKNIHLVNETSAAAMAYVNFQSDNSTILVGVCNDSHFDAAVYDIHCRQLRMISSCGDHHSSILETKGYSIYSLLSKAYESSKSFLFGTEDKFEAEQKIKQMVGELKSQIRTSVCVDTNPGGLSCYRNIAPLLVRNCKESTFKVGDSLDIVTGAAVVASLLECNESTLHDKLFMQNFIQDKLTYNFEIAYDGKTPKFVEYKSNLINSKGGGALTHYITLEGSDCSETCVTIKENGEFAGSLRYQNPGDKTVRLKGTVSNEGILKVKLFTGTKQTQQPVDFTWNSQNMTTKEVEDMVGYVQPLQGKSKERKLFQQTKRELRDLLDYLRPKLDTLQGIKKTIVTKSVEEAAAVVDHRNSTAVMMQNKVDQLVVLRSKYFQ